METFKLKNNTLELVCRTCLKLNKVRFNLFKHSQNERLICDMLKECFSIKIHKDDGFPVNICSNCLERLSSACDFKTMVMQSDAKLHIFYESKELQNNISSIYVKEETIILKSEEINTIFDLTEKVDFKTITHNNLQEKLSVNNSIKCNTSILFPKEQSKSRDGSNSTQFSSPNVIQLTSSATSNNHTNLDDRVINSYSENKYVGQTELMSTEHFIKEDVLDAEKSNSFIDESNLLPSCSEISEKTRKKPKIKRKRNQSDILNTNNKLFKCEKCTRSFAREYILKQHMRVHLETKEFSCEICGKTFRTLHGAQIHKSTHSDERPYKCNVCDKTFKYNDTLKQHQLIHKNDKKFVCELCGKSFINSSGLIHHRSTHNTEKSFVCTVCGKCFKSQPLLSDHLRRHSDNKPYICQYCDSRFKCSNVLKSHILIHTGAKPFSCKICDKKFRQRPSLRYHMRIHTGETPYECELCSSKFKYKQHLSNHMKIHNSESSQK